MTQEKFSGNININDKLTLAPHRLLSLDANKIVIIAENSGGWCMSNQDDYLYLKDLFAQHEIIFNSYIDQQTADLLKLLWNSDLVAKNGTCLSQLIRPFAPVLLVLKITGNCNLNCAYCYDYSTSRINSIIPIDKVKETMAFILTKNRGINLVMHGGEPLLQFPLIKEITEFAVKEAGTSKYLKFFMQTNGSLFNKEIVDFLEQYNYSVGISLDGMTEHANSHRLAKSQNSCLMFYQKNLKEYGDFLRKHTGVVCTLTKTNIAEISEFILWLQDQGIKGITLSPLTIAGRGTQIMNDRITTEEYIELLQTLIDMVKRNQVEGISIDAINKFVSSLVKIRPSDLCHAHPCGAGDNFLVIDAQGNYRCCDCIYHDYLLFDNHETTGLFTQRTKILDRIEYMKNHACAICTIFGLCGGGCISEALATHGVATIPAEQNCKVKKFFYKTLFKEYAFDQKRPLFAYYARTGSDRAQANNTVRVRRGFRETCFAPPNDRHGCRAGAIHHGWLLGKKFL